MVSLLILWITIFAALLLFAIGNRKDGGAFTLSYFVGLSLIHVPGALAYAAAPSYLSNYDETKLGFELTLGGMAAFALGAAVVRTLSRARISVTNQNFPIHRDLLSRISIRMTIAGLIMYFFALPLAKLVPSLTSLVYPLSALFIVGLWIQLYLAVLLRDHQRLIATFLVLPVLPFLTTITGGFLGFGVSWALTIVSFFYIIVSRRAWLLLLSPLFVYLALSLFVTYMRDRNEIREVVWQEDADYTDRIARVDRTISNFEFLDLTNSDQLDALDARLNQNFFVGLAIERIEAGDSEFEYGGTVPVWALIPRIIWPEKPQVGGGRTVVRDVTGLDLDDQTSFGAGQVLEFYINFGWPGVLIGFFGLGALLRCLDRGVMQAIGKADVRRLLLCAIPGYVLVQPEGNLLEILVSAVAALTMAYLLGLKAATWIPPQLEARAAKV